MAEPLMEQRALSDVSMGGSLNSFVCPSANAEDGERVEAAIENITAGITLDHLRNWQRGGKLEKLSNRRLISHFFDLLVVNHLPTSAAAAQNSA